MVEKPSRLDTLVDEAVTLHRQLEKLEDNPKLSYKAFLAESLQIAHCDVKRIDEVEQILADRPGADSIRRFVRKLAYEFREPRYVRPFPDVSKAGRIYGSEELAGEMAQHGIKVGELQCVAIRSTKARFGDEVFGPVESLHEHSKKTTESRIRRAAIFEQMREVVCGADLTWSQEGLFSEEVARGLCKVCFKRFPDIGPHMGDWPTALVQAIGNAPKTKLKRERIKKAA